MLFLIAVKDSLKLLFHPTIHPCVYVCQCMQPFRHPASYLLAFIIKVIELWRHSWLKMAIQPIHIPLAFPIPPLPLKVLTWHDFKIFALHKVTWIITNASIFQVINMWFNVFLKQNYVLTGCFTFEITGSTVEYLR